MLIRTILEMKKSKENPYLKRLMLVLLMGMLIFFIDGCTEQPRLDKQLNMEETRIKNADNLGVTCETEEYFYYMIDDGGMKGLYRSDHDYKHFEKVEEVYGFHLNVIDDMIYYIDDYKVYCLSLNGDEKNIISDLNSYRLVSHKDNLIFEGECEDCDSKKALYQMQTSTGMMKKLADGPADNIFPLEDEVMFLQDGKIYSVKYDIQELTLITNNFSEPIYSFVVIDDNIFFSTFYDFYKADKDGNGVEQVQIKGKLIQPDSLNIYNDNLLFSCIGVNHMADDRGIFFYNTKTGATDRIQGFDGTVYAMSILKDEIIYMEDNKLFRMDMNGLVKEIIPTE